MFSESADQGSLADGAGRFVFAGLPSGASSRLGAELSGFATGHRRRPRSIPSGRQPALVPRRLRPVPVVRCQATAETDPYDQLDIRVSFECRLTARRDGARSRRPAPSSTRVQSGAGFPASGELSRPCSCISPAVPQPPCPARSSPRLRSGSLVSANPTSAAHRRRRRGSPSGRSPARRLTS